MSQEFQADPPQGKEQEKLDDRRDPHIGRRDSQIVQNNLQDGVVVAKERLIRAPPRIIPREPGEKSEIVLILPETILPAACQDRNRGDCQISKERTEKQPGEKSVSSQQQRKSQSKRPMRLDRQDDCSQPKGCPAHFLLHGGIDQKGGT